MTVADQVRELLAAIVLDAKSSDNDRAEARRHLLAVEEDFDPTLLGDDDLDQFLAICERYLAARRRRADLVKR